MARKAQEKRSSATPGEAATKGALSQAAADHASAVEQALAKEEKPTASKLPAKRQAANQAPEVTVPPSAVFKAIWLSARPADAADSVHTPNAACCLCRAWIGDSNSPGLAFRA